MKSAKSILSTTLLNVLPLSLVLVAIAPGSGVAQLQTPATPTPSLEVPAPASDERSPSKPTPSSAPPTPAAETAPAEAEAKPEAATEAKPTKSPEELARWQTLVTADTLYREGKRAEAETLYRQVKPSFSATIAPEPSSQPFSDLEALSPAGRVYWREAQAGMEQKLDTRIFVPLKLLVEKYPEFVPGHVKLAQSYEERGKLEDAVATLERASGLYPNDPDLLRAKVAILVKTEQWIEASIAARQFALLNPDHPTAGEFTTLADENLKRYQGKLRSKLTGNLIGGLITGALGYAVTGNLFGPLSAIQTTALMLRGESAVGERFSKQAQRQLDMVEDEAVLTYVRELGQQLANVSGRQDFQYEFHVVLEDDLNAFALPGGKIFVNAGAIVKANSEAELAGLLAHELAHAVLSHGFQLVTQSTLTANVFQFIPLGGLVNNLVVLNYSREMEQQADVLGTRLLAAAGYAADGLRNLMVTLDKEDKKAPGIDFLSTHPITDDRVKYLESLIERSGYNRFAYEGVERHAQIQDRVKQLLREKKEREEKQRDERKRRRRDEPSP